jgi:hypothetical protein
MKRMRKERFLIAVLWLSAVALLALWFFNMFFSFNLLSAAHWMYLSELQLSGGVDRNFYVSVAAFVAGGLLGLYILIVPWHRKVRIMREVGLGDQIGLRIESGGTPEAAPAPKQNFILPEKPPKLHLNNVFIPVRHETAPIRHQSEPQAAPHAVPVRASAPVQQSKNPELVARIRGMLADVGFVNKEPPAIGGLRPDFWAVGSDEALVVGIYSAEQGEITAAEGGDSIWHAGQHKFQSPVWQMTGVVQKLEALFLEVVGTELKINVLPFVFVEGRIANKSAVENIWNALGVKVFDDMAALQSFISEYQPRVLDDSEKGDFDAFSDFVNTVSSYFSGGA